MAFTLADVDRAARLAHLELTDSEREQFRRDLDQITAYVAQLQGVATDLTVSETRVAQEPGDSSLRPDNAQIWPDSAKVVGAAPSSHDGFFRVPAVIEREQ